MAALIRDAKLPYHWLKGALAALLYGFPARKLTIVGVTGTDGKTTTSTMIYYLLKAAQKKVALITTVSAMIGNEHIDTGFHVTSPSPFTLQKLLRRLVAEGFTHLVLEATSHGVHQHRVWGINPEVTVLTNITPEHLDYHGTYEEYARVKSSFISRGKTIFINPSDRSFTYVKSYLQHRNKPFKTFSFAALSGRLQQVISEKFLEEYNRSNATVACMAAGSLGVKESSCVQGLLAYPGVRGRMEFVGEQSGIRGYVDFAHTPNALREALLALRKQAKGKERVIAVFGAAGKRDALKRPLMGEVVSELADEIVITSEDTRGENPEVIIHQIKEGVKKNWGHVFGIADRRKAIQFACLKLAKPGDIVAIFGKGHERSMNMDGKHEISWSDQEELLHALHLSVNQKKSKDMTS